MSTGDMAEIWGRYGGDIREMYGRYRGDIDLVEHVTDEQRLRGIEAGRVPKGVDSVPEQVALSIYPLRLVSTPLAYRSKWRTTTYESSSTSSVHRGSAEEAAREWSSRRPSKWRACASQ